MLFIGLLSGAPGMAVPAAIVAGIGCILYYQDQTGNWGSWAYLWTLIPGFVGLGVFISEILEGHLREAVRSGVRLMLISVVLFLIFAAFLGGPNLLGAYWPVLLILLGIYLMASPWVKFKK
jgi:phosphatidylserine synthase